MERLKVTRKATAAGKAAPAKKPPPQRRAFSTMHTSEPIQEVGDPAEAAALAALFRVEPSEARALTHGFHSYAGRMHPTIARGAIRRFSKRASVVLDPFCGSGTVLVEALVAGRAALGLDASPLAVRLAKVRTSPLGEVGRERLVAAAREIAEASGERARKRQRPEIPEWAADEKRHFHPHIAFELFGLRELVMDTPEDEVGQALRLCFSSLLVKFMRAGPEAPRDGAEKRLGRGIPSRFFADRAEELARGLKELESRTPSGTPPAKVTGGDARSYQQIEAGTVDLIVTSPPYAGTYDYADQHAVRFRWMGLDERGFRQRQVGDRSHGLGASVNAWNEGRRRWLAEMARVLRRGGHALLVVGDGVVGDRAEDAALAVEAETAALGLLSIARASQDRPTRDKRLIAIFGGAPRREHILLLRRK